VDVGHYVERVDPCGPVVRPGEEPLAERRTAGAELVGDDVDVGA